MFSKQPCGKVGFGALSPCVVLSSGSSVTCPLSGPGVLYRWFTASGASLRTLEQQGAWSISIQNEVPYIQQRSLSDQH